MDYDRIRIDRGRIFKIYALTILLLGGIDGKKEIPSYIHVCRRSDPKVGDCIRDSVDFLKPKLAVGIPELKIPPLEPLYIERLTAIDGKGFNVVARDLNIKGCSAFTIVDIKADIDNGVFESKLYYPELAITGKYMVNGSILLLPIKGEGELESQVRNSTAVVTMTSTFVEEDGERHLKWKGMKIEVDIEKGKVHLTNLFGGERVLGDVVNAAINMNFNNFFKELKPMIEKVLAEFLLETAQKITQGYDYNELFPN